MRSLILLFSFSISLSIALAQTLVDSTCKHYFTITDQLRNGDTLDTKLWNELMKDKSIQLYLSLPRSVSQFPLEFKPPVGIQLAS